MTGQAKHFEELGGLTVDVGKDHLGATLLGDVNHSEKEYVRGDVHVNTAEGYFSILKRGINGVYHHVGKRHLHRSE